MIYDLILIVDLNAFIEHTLIQALTRSPYIVISQKITYSYLYPKGNKTFIYIRKNP